MNKLYLIRGLPGSGKSTLAKSMAMDLLAAHVEADMYFMQDGEYKFDAGKLNRAHNWCLQTAIEKMDQHLAVIVSNTFTQTREMHDYVRAANERNIPIVIIQCCKQYGNVHNVPEVTMQNMRNRFQDNEQLKTLWKYYHIDYQYA